jgi:hypothetical protein
MTLSWRRREEPTCTPDYRKKKADDDETTLSQLSHRLPAGDFFVRLIKNQKSTNPNPKTENQKIQKIVFVLQISLAGNRNRAAGNCRVVVF